MSRIHVISFRLGGTDGVSIEAAKWVRALESLGHEVRTVAGEGEVDSLVTGLAIGATEAPPIDELERALDGADVVIVENLASLPLNIAAREALYAVLRDRPAIFRHHDLAWQRAELAHLDGPRDRPTWHHVTINELSRRELAQRGIDATTIMNSFDCDPVLGNRSRAREILDVSDQAVALLATRAIARKNVPGAIELARRLGAVLWLLGPAEDGYSSVLESLLADSGIEVRRGLPAGLDVHDAYAGCDLVVMSSTWEGFGNPVLESVTHRRALALYPYPVAREIASYGFDFFDLHDVEGIREFLASPREELFQQNVDVARTHFNEADLATRLGELLASSGVHRMATNLLPW